MDGKGVAAAGLALVALLAGCGGGGGSATRAQAAKAFHDAETTLGNCVAATARALSEDLGPCLTTFRVDVAAIDMPDDTKTDLQSLVATIQKADINNVDSLNRVDQARAKVDQDLGISSSTSSQSST